MNTKDLNDNAMVMGSKKQKLDFNELQNVSQFLSNSNQNDQVSNNHDMDGIIICDGDTLVRFLYFLIFFSIFPFLQI